MARFTLNGKRYDTGRMVEISDDEVTTGTGTKRTGVYMTPRSKRVFVRTYSIWNRGDGCVVGERWHEADEYEIAALAESYEELMELVPDDSE
jgi:hypothetical protein